MDPLFVLLLVLALAFLPMAFEARLAARQSRLERHREKRQCQDEEEDEQGIHQAA